MIKSVPRVSIVVPALNASEWIAAALRSVTPQAYPADFFEVIVVDDGSSDDTAHVASRVLTESDVPHAVISNTTPAGPSQARNLGWRRASAEWIQFLDADDLLEPSKIQRQINAAELNPEAAVIFSPWGRLSERSGEWSEEPGWVDPDVGPDALLDVLQTRNFMQLGSLLISRHALERTGGFNPSYRLIEDVDLLMRIAIEGGRFIKVPSDRPLSWYRQRAGSLSRHNQKDFIDGCLRNAQFAERYWRERDQLTDERVTVIADVYSMAIKYYVDHDADSFRSLTQRLLELQPAYAPRGSMALRLLARVGGYARAERYAARYRRFKRSLFVESAESAGRN